MLLEGHMEKINSFWKLSVGYNDKFVMFWPRCVLSVAPLHTVTDAKSTKYYPWTEHNDALVEEVLL